MVATRIEWEATSAAVLGPGKREVKTAEEEDTEHVRLHLRDPASWASGERQSWAGAPL